MTKEIEQPYRNEVILPRRVVQQPQPPFNADGDCGCCVIAGLLGITVKEVYDRKGEVTPFSWLSLHKVVGQAYWDGELDRFIDKVPYWPNPDALRGFGDPSWLSNLEWFSYVRMGLDAGYYGLMNLNFDGAGPLELSDHFVLIAGARDHEIPHPTMEGASSITKELLISDSSTKQPDERWVDHLELLRNHGGFNIMLARPSEG
ncbi:MAG: hypothetical protein ACYTAO_02130 [Planctomycetota bacterium]|jgi:hypothetical protein